MATFTTSVADTPSALPTVTPKVAHFQPLPGEGGRASHHPHIRGDRVVRAAGREDANKNRNAAGAVVSWVKAPEDESVNSPL